MVTQSIQPISTEKLTQAEWKFDENESSVRFSINHMKFATVRGQFDRFEGTIRVGDWSTLDAEVDVAIDASSINTGEPKRDEHLRSEDFFDVESYPTLEFQSMRIEPVRPNDMNRWLIAGNLTIRGSSRPVKLAVKWPGATPGHQIDESSTFVATTMIRRREFGIGLHFPLQGLGIVIGDDVTISIEIRGLKPSRVDF